MILNPNVKTVELPQGVSWAKLTAPKEGLTFEFLVNPEEVVWQHSSSFKELPVLYTSQPQLAYQNSASSLSMPKVYLWTPGHSGGLDAVIASLVQMTKPVAEEMPVLSLTWGNLSLPRVYLKSLNVREQQHRGGQVSQAVAALEFILAPEPVKVQATEVQLKLTARERDEYQKAIVSTLTKDKNRAKNLGIDPKKDIKVATDGTLLYNGKPVGNLKTKMPELLKPQHKNL